MTEDNTVKKGNRWTIEEEEQLIKAIHDGKKVSELSEQHGRSKKAIDKRACMIMMRYNKDGKSIKDIAKIFNKSEELIEKLIKKYDYIHDLDPPKPKKDNTVENKQKVWVGPEMSIFGDTVVLNEIKDLIVEIRDLLKEKNN